MGLLRLIDSKHITGKGYKMSNSISFRGQEIIALGRYDSDGIWFYFAAADRMVPPPPHGGMGPWIVRIARPNQPYQEKCVSASDARIITCEFRRLRESRGILY